MNKTHWVKQVTKFKFKERKMKRKKTMGGEDDILRLHVPGARTSPVGESWEEGVFAPDCSS